LGIIVIGETLAMFRILPIVVAFLLFAHSENLFPQSLEESSTERQQPLLNKPRDAQKPHSDTQRSKLSPVESVKLTGIDTGMIVDTLECDTEGNFYLRNEIDFQSPIHKVSLKGEKKADFLASSATDLPNLPHQLAHSGQFSVTEDGELYLEVMASMTEHDFLVFGKDGIYKSKIELENGSLWHVKKFALFPSGQFLITGEEWQKPKQKYAPFTAIFSSRGTFLKELSLPDDDKIDQSTVAGSNSVSRGANNPAVWRGDMKSATNGNIYLMRWLSPAVVYAIGTHRRKTSVPLLKPSMADADLRSTIENRHVGSRSGAVSLRSRLPGAPRFLWDWAH
jgi:hypothetical protein